MFYSVACIISVASPGQHLWFIRTKWCYINKRHIIIIIIIIIWLLLLLLNDIFLYLHTLDVILELHTWEWMPFAVTTKLFHGKVCRPLKEKPKWVLAMVMAIVLQENGEFCIAVGPVTRTVGILTWLVKALAANGAGHPANLYASLIGFLRRRLKGLLSGTHVMDIICCMLLGRWNGPGQPCCIKTTRRRWCTGLQIMWILFQYSLFSRSCAV